MDEAQRMDALGRLEGVRDASLIDHAGNVVASSTSDSHAAKINAGLQPLLARLAETSAQFAGGLHLTIEGEAGGIQMAQAQNHTILATMTEDANIGALKIEIRDASANLT